MPRQKSSPPLSTLPSALEREVAAHNHAMASGTVFLFVLLALCSATGVAQTAQPSITLGNHVLRLGMQENAVLEALKRDFEVRPVSGSPAQATWSVLKKVDSNFRLVGTLSFTGHKLTGADREWGVEEPSSTKSLFYAAYRATASLEDDGLTNCHISTSTKSFVMQLPTGNGRGNVTQTDIVMDCGIKEIQIIELLTDVPETIPMKFQVVERLGK